MLRNSFVWCALILGFALSGCGGSGNGGRSTNAVGPSRLRLFNDSNTSNLGVALDGTPLSSVSVSGAGPGHMTAYTGIPDGTVNLSARANGGAGIGVGSTTAEFEEDTDYTAYVVGDGPSAPVVFARDTNFAATSMTSRCVQVVDLLETTETHHFVLYKNGEIFFVATNDHPTDGWILRCLSNRGQYHSRSYRWHRYGQAESYLSDQGWCRRGGLGRHLRYSVESKVPSPQGCMGWKFSVGLVGIPSTARSKEPSLLAYA